ncbi:hypothetical protein L1987_64100 [Smallanthus sonchifolius]|uniref:Uncharacterized protein n=1 Tax=Smallanthus sonchifolius TaxID=185202 RepID=A0ACB9CFF3_9ASTR|nr:hypothetical protein L1987_64100 [Smallanthus sonchifolius]
MVRHEAALSIEPVISPIILNMWALHVSDPFISIDILEAIKNAPGWLKTLGKNFKMRGWVFVAVTTLLNVGKNLVFYGSALSSDEKFALADFACSSGAVVLKFWRNDVTHVIAATDSNVFIIILEK